MVRMGDYLDAINYLFYLILLWIVLILLWYAFKSLKPQIGAAVLILICAAIYLVAYQLFFPCLSDDSNRAGHRQHHHCL